MGFWMSFMYTRSVYSGQSIVSVRKQWSAWATEFVVDRRVFHSPPMQEPNGTPACTFWHAGNTRREPRDLC